MSTLNQINQKIRSFPKLWLRQSLIKIQKVDHLYKNVEKLSPIPSEVVMTPELSSMPVSDSSFRQIDKQLFTTPEIYTAIFPNVIYHPKREVIFSNSRKLIEESVRNPPKLEKFSIRDAYLAKLENISGFCSSFRSYTNYSNYYHSLIDYIPRAYLLNQPEYQNIDEIKLLVSSNLTKIESFFLSRILPKNVKINVVGPKKNYLVEKFIFPTFLTHRRCPYLPKNYLNYFLAKFLPKRERRKVNRIYISRKSTGKGRCILNEEQLWEKLQRYKFKKYYLEDLSFEEQIELFYDAELVVAPHGAGLTNLIFSSEIKVLELFPTKSIITFYYYITKMVGGYYKYLSSKNKNINDNFYVDVSKVLEYLESW